MYTCSDTQKIQPQTSCAEQSVACNHNEIIVTHKFNLLSIHKLINVASIVQNT